MKHILIPFFLLNLACASQENETSEAESSNSIALSSAQFDEGEMKWGKIENRVFSETISTRGHVDVPPASKASISVYFPGYVQQISMLPGQKVVEGETLFTIRNMAFIDMQEEYLETREKLSQLDADYKRQRELADENIASQKSLKKAESDFRVMEARHLGIREQLKLLNISIAGLESGKFVNEIAVYSPISGFVTDVSINKGSYVRPEQVALEITNTEHLHLELNVFEQDAIRVQEGQLISFSVNGDSVFSGEVYLVGKEVGGDDRSVQIHGHVAEGIRGLVPGMFVTAEIHVNKRKVYALPESAIIDLDGITYLLVRKAGEEIVLDQIEVETGKKSEGWIEIRSPQLLEKEVLVEGGFQVARE